ALQAAALQPLHQRIERTGEHESHHQQHHDGVELEEQPHTRDRRQDPHDRARRDLEADDGFRWRRCLHRISYGVEAALRRPLAPSKPKPLLSSCDYGCTTALPARVTCVCANSRPFTDAPVPSVICVFPNTTPSKCEVVPRLTIPATCQTMFCG